MHELDTLAARRDALDDAELANLEEQSTVVDDLAEAASRRGRPRGRGRRRRRRAGGRRGGDRRADGELTVERGRRRRPASTWRRSPTTSAGAPASAASPSPSWTAGGAAAATSTCRPSSSTPVQATPPGEYADCPQCGRMLVP